MESEFFAVTKGGGGGNKYNNVKIANWFEAFLQ